jgi:hypothetical protein
MLNTVLAHAPDEIVSDAAAAGSPAQRLAIVMAWAKAQTGLFRLWTASPVTSTLRAVGERSAQRESSGNSGFPTSSTPPPAT